jgi:hypothetical protein
MKLPNALPEKPRTCARRAAHHEAELDSLLDVLLPPDLGLHVSRNCQRLKNSKKAVGNATSRGHYQGATYSGHVGGRHHCGIWIGRGHDAARGPPKEKVLRFAVRVKGTGEPRTRLMRDARCEITADGDDGENAGKGQSGRRDRG